MGVDVEHPFKVLLAEKLTETEGRSMYTGSEVRDILLDLWNLVESTPEELVTV